jgi:hypothetical protein
MLRSRFRPGDDSGVALIAAMAVATMGIFMAVLLVTQAIMVTRDAHRDSIRTLEIHAAEAAIDATLDILERSSPCPGPTFATIGTGSQAVNVAVTITYGNASGPLTNCQGGIISGVPTQARVVATSTPVQPLYGIDPSRSMEVRVELAPRTGDNVAFFSQSQQSATNFQLVNKIAGKNAGFWMDNGNFVCTNSDFDGDVTLPNGSATLDSDCVVSGNLYTKTGVTFQNGSAGSGSSRVTVVYKGVTVQDGGLYSANRKITVNGDVKLKGTVTTGSGGSLQVSGGTLLQNQTGITPRATADMPIVGVHSADWPSNFTFKTRAGWQADMITYSGRTVTTANQAKFKLCQATNTMFSGSPATLTVNLPAVNTAYDLTEASSGSDSCTNSSLTMQNITYNLSADVVFFVESIDGTQLSFKSADGAVHRVWVIVPHPNAMTSYSTYQDGDVNFGGGIGVTSPVEIMIYSPNTMTYIATTEPTGQLYAYKLYVSFPVSWKFRYSDIGIPGVDMSPLAQDGSQVTLDYKRETTP